jgi:hypothetical protein
MVTTGPARVISQSVTSMATNSERRKAPGETHQEQRQAPCFRAAPTRGTAWRSQRKLVGTKPCVWAQQAMKSFQPAR